MTSFTSSPSGFGTIGTSYFAYYFALTILANVVLILAVTVGICRDARRVREAGAGTHFFGPLGWTVVAFCASFLGSVMGAMTIIAVYWLIHHSTLRRH